MKKKNSKKKNPHKKKIVLPTDLKFMLGMTTLFESLECDLNNNCFDLEQDIIQLKRELNEI